MVTLSPVRPDVRAERPSPVWRLVREADDGPQILGGQVPCRWRCARAKGRASPCVLPLEPQVFDALAVLRQVFPLVEPVEMIDRDMRDRPGLRRTEVHGDPSATLFIGLQPTPVGDVAAPGTEVEAQRAPAYVRRGRPADLDGLVFVTVGPERSIPAASRAVACGDRLRQRIQLPTDRTAVT